MFPFYAGLFQRALSGMPSTLGSNAFGLIWPVIVVAVGEVIAAFLYGWSAMISKWRQASQIGLASLGLCYTVLFGWSALTVNFAERSSLDTKVTSLSHDKETNDARLDYAVLNEKSTCAETGGMNKSLQAQNRDQQNSINNCQNQALKFLSPPPTKVELLLLEKDRAVEGSFESTFVIITNRALSPITLTFECSDDFTAMNVVPLSPTRAMPIGMGAHPSTLRHLTLDISSPALTPSTPFFVQVMYRSKGTTCSLQV